jgi:hypothetical protein
MWCASAKRIPKRKIQQVQRIAEIYRYAREVLVWLGDTEELNKCINFFWCLSSSRHGLLSRPTVPTKHRGGTWPFLWTHENRYHSEVSCSFVLYDSLGHPEGLPQTAHFFCGSLDLTSNALNYAIFALKKSTFDFDEDVLDHIRCLEWEAIKHLSTRIPTNAVAFWISSFDLIGSHAQTTTIIFTPTFAQ